MGALLSYSVITTFHVDKKHPLRSKLYQLHAAGGDLVGLGYLSELLSHSFLLPGLESRPHIPNCGKPLAIGRGENLQAIIA